MSTENHDIEVQEAIALLPAWFVSRMMTDVWYFGLILDSGFGLAIDRITRVTRAADGSIWLDVNMLDQPTAKRLCPPSMTLVGAPSKRTAASVAATHVVWALELTDT